MSSLVFRQLLSGRDFAKRDPMASQMVNFAYLIGDRASGEAMLVDPAYDVEGLLQILDEEGLRLTGVIGTHYHADHVGGRMMGFDVIGISDLLARQDVPIHLQKPETEFVTKVTGVGADQLVGHDPGDTLHVGNIPLQLLHTPGHTPGSQCILVEDRLVSGDTLFLDGCGRTDLPGGDAETLYHSINSGLAEVGDDVILCPGHQYSPKPTQTMLETRANNIVYRPKTAEQWLRMFGA
jgi:glyoxylase-like metal-dependent hydrolase (beta-lactamase superfamily II)